jgi:hypothetical protein
MTTSLNASNARPGSGLGKTWFVNQNEIRPRTAGDQRFLGTPTYPFHALSVANINSATNQVSFSNSSNAAKVQVECATGKIFPAEQNDSTRCGDQDYAWGEGWFRELVVGRTFDVNGQRALWQLPSSLCANNHTVEEKLPWFGDTGANQFTSYTSPREGTALFLTVLYDGDARPDDTATMTFRLYNVTTAVSIAVTTGTSDFITGTPSSKVYTTPSSNLYFERGHVLETTAICNGAVSETGDFAIIWACSMSSSA